MTAKYEINTVAKRLQTAKTVNTPIIVETKQKCVELFINMLEENGLISKTKQFKYSCVVKVNEATTIITILPCFKHVKLAKLQEWADKLLPTREGCLIISTNKGFMSHNEALKKRIGGQIVGFAY